MSRPDAAVLRRAFENLYRAANLVRTARLIIDVSFALLAIVLGLLDATTPVLGAIALLWIWARELPLDHAIDQKATSAAKIQEEFDISLGGLDWNSFLCEGKVDAESILEAAKNKSSGPPEPYYAPTPHVQDSLAAAIRQYQSAAWSRLDQRAYSRFNYWTGAIATVGVFVVGWFTGATTEEFVTLIVAPTSPLVLGRLQVGLAHSRGAIERKRIRGLAQLQVEGADSSIGPNKLAVRSIQDQLFLARRDGTRVPNWFYRVWRSKRISGVDAQADTYASGAAET